MMDTVLIGAEKVEHAGYSIRNAATGMRNAASWMTEAFQQHQRFLDDWLARFEAVLEDKQKDEPTSGGRGEGGS